jgi:hypothetical protein
MKGAVKAITSATAPCMKAHWDWPETGSAATALANQAAMMKDVTTAVKGELAQS